MPASRTSNQPSLEFDPAELVIAIGHEVGNHLGGIRLQAHFLDEDLDARALATSSVEIDVLAGRAGALLALLRPVLAEKRADARPIRWTPLLLELRKSLEEEGTRGVPFKIALPKEEELVGVGVEGFHSLVSALVSATIERLDASQRLEVSIEPREDACALVIRADGEGDDLDGRGGLRGRSLVLAIAGRLLSPVNGRVEVAGSEGSTAIALVVPNF